MGSRHRWIRADDDVVEDRVTLQEEEQTPRLPSRPAVGVSLTLLSGTAARHLFFLGENGGIIGRGRPVDVHLTDPGISRWHAQIERRDEGFVVLDLDSTNGVFVDDVRVDGVTPLPPNCRLALGPHVVLLCTLVDDRAARDVKRIERQVLFDTLTGVGNRDFFGQRLREELAFSLRHGQSLGLLFVDLDHFKQVNDRHGHAAGDAVLRAVGEALDEAVREEDSVYRYGGEEFVVLARGTNRLGLYRIGERIRISIEDLSVCTNDAGIRVTASVGAAILDPEQMLEMETLGADTSGDEPVQGSILLEMADVALYEAKDQGRNRVVVSGGPGG